MKAENLVGFLIEVGKLKKLNRKGWIIHRVKNSESVADHSFRTSIMAYLLAKRFGLNKEIKEILKEIMKKRPKQSVI